jgi:polyisoprenoid-binding protein YceI
MSFLKIRLMILAFVAASVGVVSYARVSGTPESGARPTIENNWAGGNSSLAPESYTIDPAHSTIGFSVRHLVINNIHGRFNEFSGTISYDAADISKSSVEFKAKAASIDTGVAQRDQHLRSADFFEVEKYPELTFKSTRVERKGKDAYVAHGTFTMKGVNKEIAIPFKLFGPIADQRKKQRIGVEAGLVINRQEYGITYGGKLDNGGLAVGNDVNIILNLEAIKQ